MILFDTQYTQLIKYFVHSLQKSRKRNVKSLQLIILCVYAYVMMEFDEEDSHSISLYIYLTVKAHVQFHNSLPTHSATF